MVTFTQIPNGIRTPLVAVEIDSSQAQGSSPARPLRCLVVGQRLSGGNVAELVPTTLTRESEVGAAFGVGSMLHSMGRAVLAQSRDIEAVFIALDDPSGGTKATGTIQFAASSPLAGQVAIYVGGRRYSLTTSSSSTGTTLAAALVAAINADPEAHVTASDSTDTVTVTALHAGVAAGKIDLRHSYQVGEQLPSGVTVTVTAMSGGAGDPDIAALVAALPDEKYDTIAFPYTDATSLTAIEDELADRFGPMRALAGVAFTATNGSFGAAGTLGNTRNSPHLSILSSLGSPSPEWDWAAAAAMVAAREANLDPARPLQTVQLTGLLAPVSSARLQQSERNLLLYDGISTTVVNPSGRVAVERLITTYKLSAQGAADTAYLDVTTLAVLDYLRYDVVTRFQTKYPRHKIADDGVQVAPGQAVITPSVARAELIAIARGWEQLGLVESVDDFKADIIAARNAQDPSRLDLFIPPDLINALRVVAAQIGFRL